MEVKILLECLKFFTDNYLKAFVINNQLFRDLEFRK